MSRHNRYDQRDTRDIKCKKGVDCWYLFNSTCLYYHPKWQVQQARQYKRQQQEKQKRKNERRRRSRSRSKSENRRRRNRNRRSRSSSREYSRDGSSRNSRGSSSRQSRDRKSRTPQRRRSRSSQRRQTIIVQNSQIIPSRPNFLSPQDYDRHIASLSSPDHEFARQFQPKSKDGDEQFVDNLLQNLRKSKPKQVQKPSKQHWSTQHLEAQLDSDQIQKEYPRAYRRYLQIVAQQDYLYARIFNNYFVRLQDQADQEDEQEWIRQYQEWMVGVDIGNEEDYMFFIENIRKYKLRDMTREQKEHHNACPICMQSFVDSDADQNIEIGHLYCNHAYHKNCILDYLNPPEKWNQAAQENLVHRHPKCPLCKKDFRDHDDYKEFDPNYKDRINIVQKDD